MFIGGPMGGLNGDPDYPDEDQFYGEGGDSYLYSRATAMDNRVPFIPNKWYYHKKVDVKVLKTTDQALLVQDSQGQYWIPKKLIHLRTHKRARQWVGFKVKYLK